MINKRRVRQIAVVTGVGLTLVAGSSGVAAADSGHAVHTAHIEGQFHLQPDGSYRSSGDFLGTYTPVRERVESSTEVGGYTLRSVTGEDRMSGCLDLNHNGRCDRRGPRGTITMSFLRTATFDRTGTVFIESYCSHPVTGTTSRRSGKRFTGGLIFMADRARDGQGGDIESTYRGTVTYR